MSGLQPIELTTSQQFDLERMTRAIDACQDVERPRAMTHRLARSWMAQQAVLRWHVDQQAAADAQPRPGASQAPLAA